MGTGLLARSPLVRFGGRLPTLADRFDGRANSIGVLRLTLAIAVLVAHCWPLALGRPMLGSAETMRQTDVGKLAVYGFFVLSGFLITGSALRFSLPRYLWHRALRILPGLWVCLLLTALVMAPAVAYYELGTLAGFWDHPYGPWQYLRSNWLFAMDQWTISGILGDVPYGRGLEGGGPVNGSLWTLRYEVVCYVMLAALVAASVLARARGAVVLLLLGAYGVVVEDFVRGDGLIARPPKHGVLGPYPVVGVFDKQVVIYLAFVFLLGAVAKLYAHRVPMTGWLAAFAAVGLAVTLRFGAFWVIGVPLLAYLLLYLAVGLPRWLHSIGRKRDYSYGIYIYAFPVQQVVALLIGVRYGFVTYLAASTAGTLVLAALSWHLVERPAMSLKNMAVPLPARLRRHGGGSQADPGTYATAADVSASRPGATAPVPVTAALPVVTATAVPMVEGPAREAPALPR
ncbi:acyltransferase family protein [Micromonospora echinaurantiaca]|uniref:acyltransferase family protein n=1 Tax=Micromonospora echinaurantiaca TaxID=47857 RepID=UPI00379516A0